MNCCLCGKETPTDKLNTVAMSKPPGSTLTHPGFSWNICPACWLISWEITHHLVADNMARLQTILWVNKEGIEL